MSGLGKLSPVTLRSYWKNEATDFTRWLAEEENLKELGKIIDIDEIELVEVESDVGDFNVDIFAQDASTNTKIIIENQLEKSDHDHLGKLITYASGKEAQIIIWIVKKAREEHIQAVSWLNEKTDSSVNFFLLEIELWQIGNSLPAPKFNVVVKPNGWARAQKEFRSASDTDKLKLAFWQYFAENAFDDELFGRAFRKRAPSTRNTYTLATGRPGCEVVLRIAPSEQRISAGCYIKSAHAEIFEELKHRNYELKEDLPFEDFEWKEMDKDMQFLTSKDNIDLTNRDQWEKCLSWFKKIALSVGQFIKQKN